MQYTTRRHAQSVEESDRLSFLTYMFGTDFMLAELQVYALAKQWMPQYWGGWHFIRLPKGGGYMMPDATRVHMVNDESWFDRTVSADAAGIILTSLAITLRCAAHHDGGNAALTRLYMLRDAQLWNFVDTQPECSAIYAALD